MSSLKEILHDYHTNHRDADLIYSTSIDDYIAHHGISGQKWGVRHGPPYPLGRSVSTGKALKGGGGKSALKTGMDDDTKAVIASAIATTFFTSLYIARQYQKQNAKPRAVVKEEKDIIANSILDKTTGLYKKTRPYSREEDIALVNKANYDANVPGSGTNCVLCSMTYELRRRGYNCKAKTLPKDTGIGSNFELSAFKGAKFSKASSFEYPTTELLRNMKYRSEFINSTYKFRSGTNTKLYSESISALSKEKNSRGVFFANFGMAGGHAINYEVNSNGKVTFIDTQVGKTYNEEQAKEFLCRCVATRYMRLDNKEMNVDFLKENVIYEPQDKKSSASNSHDFNYYEENYIKPVASQKVDVRKAKVVNDAIKNTRAINNTIKKIKKGG